VGAGRFSLPAGIAIQLGQRQKLERLCRYVMVADAPKDEAEYAHGPPGGGMGDLGM
jgi:hypothetical protein